ncbi:MAG TPA: FHA domain-containing protein [Polyangiaceae bacterium]
MRGYWLRWADQSIEVDSTVIIGRSEDCAVTLDDPLVSRRHASLVRTASEIWVTDLSSRNGVYVNGVRIDERRRMLVGDSLRIGSQEMQLEYDSEGMREAISEAPEPTRRFEAMGVVGHLSEKALALGRVEEAERLLSGPLEQLLRETAAGLVPSRDMLEKSTEFAVKLIFVTRRGYWLDWLVQMYGALRKPWPASVVDSLYQVARVSSGHDRQGLRNYCEQLRTIQNDLGPAERFQVGRIEGLERVLSAL